MFIGIFKLKKENTWKKSTKYIDKGFGNALEISRETKS